MPDNTYILIGQTPVPEPDLLKWGQWFETADRVVFQTTLGDTLISTVFLGIDHRFGSTGPPLLFETMIFIDNDGSDYQRRCATWLEAEVQHQQAVAFAMGKKRQTMNNTNDEVKEFSIDRYILQPDGSTILICTDGTRIRLYSDDDKPMLSVTPAQKKGGSGGE